MKLAVSALVLLICTAALLSTTEGRPKRLQLRCSCPQMHSESAIPAVKILSLRVIPAGPHCKNEEIIATMKKGPMCLDPTKDWVISLKEEINKRNVTSQQ
ncbi:interleukin-8-like [Sinocyclocheilus anshuiensis]|uniref:Interleukin-8-like n=1 Tax=Sinocyclocheilus anshuiensis TaxID=1608454 RepID=A0A671S3T5_9TELE|nr:PREDICTED: interleukin-8-like [Sinocyclocheilus anshuiensis]